MSNTSFIDTAITVPLISVPSIGDFDKNSYKTINSFDSAGLKEFYYKYSYEKQKSINSFISSKMFKSFGSLLDNTFKYDIVNRKYNDYIYLVQNAIELQKKYENLNSIYKDAFCCYFVTLTLPSEYHFSSSSYGGYTIAQGYSKLKYCFTRILKWFNDNKIGSHLRDYIKVIEPHKSYIPHMHFLMYMPSHIASKFELYVNKLIKKHLGTQNKIEPIRNISRGVAYLVKYLAKSFKGLKQSKKNVSLGYKEYKDKYFDILALNGWCCFNKIRFASFSRGVVPKYLYRVLSTYDKAHNPTPKGVNQMALIKSRLDSGYYQVSKCYKPVYNYSPKPVQVVHYDIFGCEVSNKIVIPMIPDSKCNSVNCDVKLKYKKLQFKVYVNKQSHYELIGGNGLIKCYSYTDDLNDEAKDDMLLSRASLRYDRRFINSSFSYDKYFSVIKYYEVFEDYDYRDYSNCDKVSAVCFDIDGNIL